MYRFIMSICMRVNHVLWYHNVYILEVHTFVIKTYNGECIFLLICHTDLWLFLYNNVMLETEDSLVHTANQESNLKQESCRSFQFGIHRCAVCLLLEQLILNMI